jgi:hypothetical protein
MSSLFVACIVRIRKIGRKLGEPGSRKVHATDGHTLASKFSIRKRPIHRIGPSVWLKKTFNIGSAF